MKETKTSLDTRLYNTKILPAESFRIFVLIMDNIGDNKKWENITIKHNMTGVIHCSTATVFKHFKYLRFLGVIKYSGKKKNGKVTIGYQNQGYWNTAALHALENNPGLGSKILEDIRHGNFNKDAWMRKIRKLNELEYKKRFQGRFQVNKVNNEKGKQ